jgi:hypothetical protein
MIGTALAMFIAVTLLVTHLERTTMRRIVGYALLVDIVVLIGMLTVFGGTGEERLGAIGMTIGITGALHAYRFVFGYEKLVRRGTRLVWVLHPSRFAR